MIALAAVTPRVAAQTSAPNEWTWVGGSSTRGSDCDHSTSCGFAGVYGTLGTPATGNIPGSRNSASSWTDSSGNLWLFGGDGYDSAGSNLNDLNDLWEFRPSTNLWVWMAGSDTAQAVGNYGTLGQPAAGNTPGARSGASSWTDSNGNFWLFGGTNVVDSGLIGYFDGQLNDLWKFNPSTNQWTWMGGSNGSSGQSGVYGTLGTPGIGNIPGSRLGAATWTDESGHLWLFGGNGYDANGNSGYLNDLWEFNPSTNDWTWMGGSNTLPANSGWRGRQPGVYGTLGVPASGNIPGGRFGASNWIDSSGNLWLFGGASTDPGGNSALLNDLWEFNPTDGEWAWMGGSNALITETNGVYALPGVYGTLDTPAAGNIPGSREFALTWTDPGGDLWLFGGEGSDSVDHNGTLNDLWEFNPSTRDWTWMGGSSTINYSGTVGNPGIFGALGTPAANNIPGGLDGASSWTDNSGHFWIFGGDGYDANDNSGFLNDLWEYQPYPAAAAPTFSAATGTYTVAQTVTISDTIATATIYYTTDGTTPTPSSTIYTGPIIVSATQTIEAIATANEYLSSGVAIATYTIPPDFTMAINPASVSVQAGQDGPTTVTVQDEGGFNSGVSFACSGLPAGDTCSFSNLTVPTSTGVSYSTLTVSTAANTAAIHRRSGPLFPGAVLGVAFCCFGWGRRRSRQLIVLLAVGVVGLCPLSGCGSGRSGGGAPPVQPVTSTITVTASSGSLTHTATFSLTVN